MSAARVLFFAALLSVGVAVVGQGLVSLVEASGAKDQPALILVLLLSAFLGLLTAVLARALDLPGAVAPTALVLGWIVVPPILGAIPSELTDFLAGNAALKTGEAVALAVAVVSAAVTLAVSGRQR